MSFDERPRRGLWLGGILAIVIGLTAWALHRAPAALVIPPDCPGLLEATAALAFRVMPTVPAGIWMLRANAMLLALAIGATTMLLRLVSGSWIVAAAVGFAIAAQPILAPALSPWDPALLLVASATCAALIALPASSLSSIWIAELGFLVTGLIAPRAALPLAAMAGAYIFSRRRLRALIAAAVVLGSSLAMPVVTARLPPQFGAASQVSCALPLPFAEFARAWLNGAQMALSSMGPYAVGLAALGAFVLISNRHAALWAVTYALAASMGTASSAEPFLRGFGTLLIGVWLCLAVGLREVLRACAPSTAGRIAAVLLVTLLPGFQILRFPSAGQAPETYGLERLSVHDLKHLLALFPDRSALVQEDATVAVLLRGLSGDWEKMGKTFGLVRRDPDAVYQVEAGAQMHVFALPASQAELQWLGVALTEAPLADVAGVAEARSGGFCERTKSRWLELSTIPGAHATVLSLVANAPGADHATILYIASDAAAHPAAVNWPPLALDGFLPSTYAENVSGDMTLLASDEREDRVSPELASRLRPFVTRLRLWRTSTGPAVLPVDLGRRPTLVIARGDSTGSDKVCPAFPFRVQTIRIGP